jgi:hypothetical protein
MIIHNIAIASIIILFIVVIASIIDGEFVHEWNFIDEIKRKIDLRKIDKKIAKLKRTQ